MSPGLTGCSLVKIWKQLFCFWLVLLSIALIVPVVQADWPEFRGPSGNGHSESTGLVLHWSETENIAWKTSIPHHGWSTPVVMNGQIWLTTAAADGHGMFAVCVDSQTGEIIFNEKLFDAEDPEPLNINTNTYASPSPVLEPGRVYANFGRYGTACIDTKTFDVIWRRNDIHCRHSVGPGSSLVAHEDMLILTMDGTDAQYLTALNKSTGKTIWKVDRTAEWDDLDDDGQPKQNGEYRKAFSTPLIAGINGQSQIVSIGAKAVYGYEPDSGKEIWKIAHSGFSTIPRPVFTETIAYVITGFGGTEIIAFKIDGKDQITNTNIIWRERTVPTTASPILIDGMLLAISDGGILKCLDSQTGEEIWKERLEGDFAASLICAAGRIYCSNKTGTTTVFKPAREYQHLATNKLEQEQMASLAVDGNALILRTKTHLYKIEDSNIKQQ